MGALRVERVSAAAKAAGSGETTRGHALCKWRPTCECCWLRRELALGRVWGRVGQTDSTLHLHGSLCGLFEGALACHMPPSGKVTQRQLDQRVVQAHEDPECGTLQNVYGFLTTNALSLTL